MLAFASVIGSQDKFRRCAAPGIGRVKEPGALVAEYTDATSMCTAYNEVLDAFAEREDLEGLVLLHDDTEILDPEFCAKVRRRLADDDVAVVGVVGARDVRSLEWWNAEPRGRVKETRGHIDFGGHDEDVDAVDGLLLVLSPWAVRNLRFDADRFDAFHGYDVDFCFQARAAGRRVVVDDIELFHHTKGGYGDEDAFRRADAAFKGKWFVPEASSPAERPSAAGVREGVEELGRYYDGDRPDLQALVPHDAERILDVGCGTGSLLMSLKARQGAEVTGIELMPGAAALARERLDRFEQLNLDGLDELPFEKAYFDVAIFGDVLEHLRDPARLLRAVRRHLRPDGRIVCSVPNVKHWTVLAPLLLEDRFQYADEGLLDRTHVHFFTLRELEAMLHDAGFAPEALDAHRIPMPANVRGLLAPLASASADGAEMVARLEAYQYLVVARPA
ncbi:MAG TPA: bifunctional glycosyltransferase/class I SAM-dependent methyltransferase [Solirubrobacteraceae bacterium]|jgi:2-polyprenyl-3-methyl-5-hydroxy-6-metoxy-1,4-benzoquinol methylase